MPNAKSQSAHYDAIVIGSGQGGTPLSQALAAAGIRAALVEREHVGGTCINEGCTPTKTMVASGRVAYLARRAADYGIHAAPRAWTCCAYANANATSFTSFAAAASAALKRRPISTSSSATRNLSLRALSPCATKRARIALSPLIVFHQRRLPPRRATNRGPQRRPLSQQHVHHGIERRSRTSPRSRRRYIGLEFGQLFRRLDSKVTVVQSANSLLTREDGDVAEAVAEILKEDGIHVLLDARAEKVARHASRIHLKIRVGGKTRSLEGSHLLVATGRIPNSDTLNLPAARIATDNYGFIHVNDKLETSAKNIYALGDIKGGPAFTHISYDDFRIIRTNLIEKGAASTTGRLVPYTVFIDPQLGRVGLTETEAHLQNRAIRVAKMPMNYVARALEIDETRAS